MTTGEAEYVLLNGWFLCDLFVAYGQKSFGILVFSCKSSLYIKTIFL